MTVLIVGLMATVAQAARVQYILHETAPGNWELYVEVTGSDTAGLSAYGMFVDDLSASFTESTLYAVKTFNPPTTLEMNGFLPMTFTDGTVSGMYNFGNYQNNDSTILPIAGVGAGIEGIGMVPVHELGIFGDVNLAVPAHLGTITTSPGLNLSDFTGEIPGLLNAASDGHLPEEEVTLCTALECNFYTLPPVADASGPYVIDLDEILILDASGSQGSIEHWEEDGIVYNGQYSIDLYEWDLDDDGVFETNADENAVFPINPTYLESLQLGVGVHDIHLKVTDDWGISVSAGTTLTIVPEPMMLALLSLGGFALIRRRRK